MSPLLFVVPVAVVAAVLGYASTRPDQMLVQRSRSIRATPEQLFGRVNRLADWQQWSPWDKMDPGMSRTYEGPAEGVGASYAWNGNRKVGSGRMEIIEVTPDQRVVIKLDFLKPFEAHNTTVFEFQPDGDSTTVTWTMTGPNLFMGKVMGLFMDMDAMIGKDFETGLANLKAAVES